MKICRKFVSLALWRIDAPVHWYLTHIWHRCLVRWCHSPQAKATSDILEAVLCFFFWRDCSAMAGRIFTKSSPADLFVVLFINGGTPQKSAPPPNFCGYKTSIFWTKIQTLPSSDGRYAGKRNSGKTKTIGITTISRLTTFTSTFGEIRFAAFELYTYLYSPSRLNKFE